MNAFDPSYRREGQLDYELTKLPPIPCTKYVIIGDSKKRKQRRPKTPIWNPYGDQPIWIPRNKMDKRSIYSDKYFDCPVEDYFGEGKIKRHENVDFDVDHCLLPRLAGIDITSKPRSRGSSRRRRRRRRQKKQGQRPSCWRFNEYHLEKSDHFCEVLGPKCCAVCHSRQTRNMAAASSYESLPVVELTTASLVAPTLASQLLRAARIRRSNQSRRRNRDVLKRGTRGIEALPKIKFDRK